MKPRWATLILGLLLLAEGAAKLADPRGYVTALAAFRLIPAPALWPVGIVWLAGELACGALLSFAGLAGEPPHKLALIAAIGALLLQVGYATLTFSAWIRGLTVENCTCFGVYLRQRLSGWVLAQDVYMLVFAGLQVRRWKLR